MNAIFKIGAVYMLKIESTLIFEIAAGLLGFTFEFFSIKTAQEKTKNA